MTTINATLSTHPRNQSPSYSFRPPGLSGTFYISEYGPRGSRKVKIIHNDTGNVVAKFTAKHFSDAREQANAWLTYLIKNGR